MVKAGLPGDIEPRVNRVMCRFKAEHQDRFGAVVGPAQPRLARVNETAVGGIEAGLCDLAHRLNAVIEVGESERRAATVGRPGRQSQPSLGNDAHGTFGADGEAVGAGAGTRGRQASRLPVTAGGNHAHALDEIIDVGGACGIMSCGAGGDPAAQAGIGIGLHEEAQRQAVRLELGVEVGTEHARLHPRRPRRGVSLQYSVHVGHVDADGALEVLADHRIYAVYGTGAAAERYCRLFGAAAPVEHGGNLGLVARIDYRVRCISEVAGETARAFHERLAIGVQRAMVGIGVADWLKAWRHGTDARRLEADLVQGWRRCRLEAIGAQGVSPDPLDRVGLFGRRTLVFAAPGVEFPPLAPVFLHSCAPLSECYYRPCLAATPPSML